MSNGAGSLEAVLVRVRALVAEIAGVNPCDVRDDAPLFDTGPDTGGLALDSLDALKLMLALSEEYGLGETVEIDHKVVPTARGVAGHVWALKTNGGVP